MGKYPAIYHRQSGKLAKKGGAMKNLTMFHFRKRTLEKIIENELCDPNLNVNRLADLLRISPQYLYELTLMHYDMNPHRFIETLRLEKVIQLLTVEHANMIILSKRTGYTNYQTFRRVVKKRLGMSPSKMRVHLQMKNEKRESKNLHEELISLLWKG
jgi:AraC-like DNA-binding protein